MKPNILGVNELPIIREGRDMPVVLPDGTLDYHLDADLKKPALGFGHVCRKCNTLFTDLGWMG